MVLTAVLTGCGFPQPALGTRADGRRGPARPNRLQRDRHCWWSIASSALGATASEDRWIVPSLRCTIAPRFDCGARPEGANKRRDWLTSHRVPLQAGSIASSPNATTETVGG